jgi:hypothetical protein
VEQDCEPAQAEVFLSCSNACLKGGRLSAHRFIAGSGRADIFFGTFGSPVYPPPGSDDLLRSLPPPDEDAFGAKSCLPGTENPMSADSASCRSNG